MTAASSPKRLRIDPGIDPDLKAWALNHTKPGGAFLTLGHALEAGLARVLDEYQFIQATCKEKRVSFDATAYWALHDDLIRQCVPNPKSAPRRHGQATHRALERVFVSVAQVLLVDIRKLAEPKGPFSAANPTAHAAEFGLLVLRQADAGTIVRGAQFPFDGAALWQRYVAQAKH